MRKYPRGIRQRSLAKDCLWWARPTISPAHLPTFAVNRRLIPSEYMSYLPGVRVNRSRLSVTS
jgi:hypothetical protein